MVSESLRFILRTDEAHASAVRCVTSAAVRSVRPLEVVIREHRPRRTPDQNDKFHAAARNLAELTGHDVEDIKRAVKVELGLTCKREFLGAIRTVLKSSADFSKLEMMDAITWLEAKYAEMSG